MCCSMSDIIEFVSSLLEEGEVLTNTFQNCDMKNPQEHQKNWVRDHKTIQLHCPFSNAHVQVLTGSKVNNVAFDA